MGIPQARAEVIKAAVADGTHHFRDQLMLLRDPQFLVNARNASSSGTGPEGTPGGTTSLALAERLAGYLGLSNRWPELLNGFTDKEFARLAKTARSHPLRGYYRTLYQYLVLGADVHWLDSLNHAQEELSLVDRKCRKKASRARVEFLKEGLECTLRQFKARLLVWEEYPLRLLVRSGSPLDPLVPPLVILLEKMGRRSSSLSESGSGSSPEWPRIGSLNMHTLVCVLKVVALLSTEEAAQEALAAVDAFTSERYSTVAAYLREGPKGPKAESPKGLINSIKTVVALSASSCEPTDEVLRGLRDALERADLLRLSGTISARLAMALPAILKKGQDPDSTP